VVGAFLEAPAPWFWAVRQWQIYQFFCKFFNIHCLRVLLGVLDLAFYCFGWALISGVDCLRVFRPCCWFVRGWGRPSCLLLFSCCLWFLKAFSFPIEIRCALLRHRTSAFCRFVIIA